MNTLLRFGALTVAAAVALFVAQPSQAVTPVVQPHSTIADTANADSLVTTTVARRGGVYRVEPSIEDAVFTAAGGSIEAVPSIGEVWFVAGYIMGRMADMGSPAATIPIRHAQLGTMAVASIAVVSSIAAASR